MTKTELIQGVQERLNCTKKDAELAVNTDFEVLTADPGIDDCSGFQGSCLQGKQDAEGRCESEVIKHKGFSKQGRE